VSENPTAGASSTVRVDDEEILREFLAETQEHMDEVESLVLAAEIASDPGTIDALFRAFHSTKGSAGFLGLESLQELSHAIENALDAVRRGERRLDSGLVDLLLKGVDIIRRMLDECAPGGRIPPEIPSHPMASEADALVAEVQDEPKPKAAPEKKPARKKTAARKTTAKKKPSGTRKTTTRKKAAPKKSPAKPAEEPPPEEKVVEPEPPKAETAPQDNPEIVAEATPEEKPEVAAEVAPEETPTEVEAEAAPVEEPEPVVLIPDDEEEAEESEVEAPEAEAEAPAPPAAEPDQAPAAPAAPVQKGPAKKAATGKNQLDDIIRVKAGKIDRLLDLVGELVIAETLVTGSLSTLGVRDHGLESRISHLVKTVKGLQDSVLSLRAVPIEGTFRRIQRAARDLTRSTGKKYRLELRGKDTEIDRSVVESLFDPLVHLLRNAIDHGLEDAEQREASGKAAEGVIILSAGHRSGDVVIEMRDDGRGIDPQKILEKARNRGLVGADANPSTNEILDFLFMPGFSTAKAVTELSGRGVGLDVVRRNLEALRGRVTVRSEPGKGTTFTLRLPLTLAIIEGMVVGLAGERYVLPLQTIERIVSPRPGDVATIRGHREVLRDRGRIQPVVRLKALFGLENGNDAQGLVVLLESHGGIFGLHVDEVLGQQQIVVKGLGSNLNKDDWIAGGAVLEDGRAGLILDVEGLAELAASYQGMGAAAGLLDMEVAV
jgi:two-component system chemotaxis sensor kinase CheA